MGHKSVAQPVSRSSIQALFPLVPLPLSQMALTVLVVPAMGGPTPPTLLTLSSPVTDGADGAGAGNGGANTSHLESQLQELTALVKFYEKKISTLADQQIIMPQVRGGSGFPAWRRIGKGRDPGWARTVCPPLPLTIHTCVGGVQDGVPGGPSSDEWILEEHVHKDEVYLLDRKTGKLFTNPGEGTWPRAVGEWAEG